MKPSSSDAAARAVQAIVQAGESLEQNPRRGAIVDEVAGLRKLLVPLGKFSFVIHYAILNDEIVILRVYHGREARPS